VDKRDIVKSQIRTKHGCKELCQECIKKFTVIDDLHAAQVPVAYWTLSMAEFTGSPKLKEATTNYITEIKQKYIDGASICFSGNQGTGKTMSAVCILRAAIKNGFTTHYTTASDLLSELTDFKNAHELKHKLKTIHFLVIDELDSRFFVSDNVKELFSGFYESVFRHRAQNLLPTIICTNETDNLLNVFFGQAKQSIGSLHSKYLQMVPIIGQDFRKKQ
jgi:DNA replication protein DnaC